MNYALCSIRCDRSVAELVHQPGLVNCAPAAVVFAAAAGRYGGSVATTARTALSEARSWIIPTFQCHQGFRQLCGASWRWCEAPMRTAARGPSGGRRSAILGDVPDGVVGERAASVPGGFALVHELADRIGALRCIRSPGPSPTVADIRPPPHGPGCDTAHARNSPWQPTTLHHATISGRGEGSAVPAHGADPLAAGCTAAHSGPPMRCGYHPRLRQLGSKFVAGTARST